MKDRHHHKDTNQNQATGICIGSSTISMVTVKCDAQGKTSVIGKDIKAHSGNPQVIFSEMLDSSRIESGARIAITGRKFRHMVNLSSIPEPQAVEFAFTHVNGERNSIQAIVSAGSEAFMLYLLGKDGRISSVHSGNKCASGTGEFFLQQIRRMNIGLEEAVRL